ncbi:MAG: histidine kinase [Bacteroidales bacterium]|jgi:signal transduction histidine kinase
MFIKAALILSVLLQFAAALIAISLIKRTRYNVSWILISIGFLLMAVRRWYELVYIYNADELIRKNLIGGWIAVVTSILMFSGVIFIRKIFNIQERLDKLRQQNESKILAAIINTEEKSRQEFSKDLHDGLGPLLSSVKMSISAIDKLKTDKSNREIIVNTEQNVDEAIAAVKEISNNLSPHVLKNFGLIKALETFISRLKTGDEIDILLESDLKEKRFDYNTEIILYRILCELIINTIKHARASKINIDCFHRKNVLELVYSDNGIGFDTEKIQDQSTGMGIPNIYSRIRSLDGTIEMYSRQNEGFHLKITLPV